MLDKLLKLLKIHFAASLVLKDGTPLEVDGNLETGANITIVTADGNIPLPDGEYQLEDMTIILVKDGIVMDVIVPGEVEMSAEGPIVEVELAQKENPEVSGEDVVIDEPEIETTGTTESTEEMVDMPIEPIDEPEIEDIKIAELEAKISAMETSLADILSKLNMVTEKFSAAQPVNKKFEVSDSGKMPIDDKMQAKVDLIKRLSKS